MENSVKIVSRRCFSRHPRLAPTTTTLKQEKNAQTLLNFKKSLLLQITKQEGDPSTPVKSQSKAFD